MADPGADNPPLSAQTSDAVRPARRQHTYSRLTTALTVLALAAAVYGLWRLDSIRDRLDEIDDASSARGSKHRVQSAEHKSIEERSTQALDELVRPLAAHDDVPKQLPVPAMETDELRVRVEGPV